MSYGDWARGGGGGGVAYYSSLALVIFDQTTRPFWTEVRGGGGSRCARILRAQIFGTRGLISADRRTKPTLMLTIPRPLSSRLQGIYRSQRLKLW
jgi:hypothetical protein